MARERYAILCVDDEPDLLDSLRVQLRHGLGSSYLIETAEDGDEAEEVFDELLRDGYELPVVIADYIMPRLKGDELLRRIHAASPESKKILLTGHATLEAMNYVIRYAGLYRYLAKPLDMEDLLMTVNEALGSYFQSQKLTRFHQGLEQSISDRTAELADRNAALEREVAERKRAEAALRSAKEAAEAATRAKSEFLASISHDLRTPLNGVLGFADLLRGAASPAQTQDYIEAIQDAGRSLLTLIDDLLDLSKAEAGKLELELRPVSLRDLLQDVPRLCAVRLKEKDLAFELSVDPELPRRLLLDPARLRQVLYNLVGNAAKFTERGSVTLTARPLDAAGNGRVTLELEVRDTGIGIPAERLDSIFEPFEQQPGQSRRYGGTGLGLTISRRLVAAMGGRIEVDSRVGEGSEFRVVLPDVEVTADSERTAADPQAREADTQALDFTGATVLIADDIDTNRRLLAELLRPYGATVIEADNGDSAVAATRQQRPDLVLMDLDMPVMSGSDAARLLRANEATRAIPIIAVTASSGPDGLRLVADPDLFTASLSKPVDADRLRRELQHHLTLTTRPLTEPIDDGAVTATEQPTAPAQPPAALAEALMALGLPGTDGSAAYPSVNALHDLSEALKQLCHQHPYAPLAALTKALEQALRRFDMGAVTRLLRELKAMTPPREGGAYSDD